MIELSLLQHFIAVARTRSFTQAAEQVHACRSVVTRSIKRLENQVGTKLLHRTTRMVTLTAAGEALLTEVEAIVDRVAIATHKARRIGRDDGAELRIGLCPSVEPKTALIAGAVREFRRRWPDVRIQLKSQLRNIQGKSLRSSQIDVGLMLLNRRDCEGLEWRVFARAPMMVWVPASWNIPGSSIRLETLRERPWVMAPPQISPDLYELEMALCRSAGFEPQAVAYPEDTLTGKMMGACELGVVFVHGWDVPASDPSLKKIEDVSQYCWSELVVAWAKNAGSVQTDNFVRCLLKAETAG